ncbi:MAG: immune inhibitor A [Crocinitomicaceae bacterium]|nr:immune inhibitor A [Crocinitomicaceae bacterium]
MKKLLLVLCTFALFSAYAQQYSRVKIYGTAEELRVLGDLGFALDHGEYKKDTYFISDFSEYEIQTLNQLGFSYDIMIQDVKAHYVEQNLEPKETFKTGSCGNTGGSSVYNPQTPSNFQLGTMGGYYKYQEFLDELDSMRSKYPSLISIKAPINSYTTIDGNPIYWLRISDNPDTDEAEEEVLYTALHHAREPASLSQLIYYMWYVLENYGTNEEITYLVDNTEMYFVPMINPDGYRYNELTDPNGGGMHRKNRRNVGTYNKGVDLNRNYGYGWNTTGVSTSQNGDTYPGTSEFSEVETQAMRWFIENHDIKFAFNAHTFGNQLLYPIGTTVAEVADHNDYFAQYTSYMVKFNGYANIKSSGLYPASGDSDDWMYRDDIGVNHDTVFAMTPECSDDVDEFWPAASKIEDICKANIHMNTTLAHMPHVFGVPTDLEASKIGASTGYFNYKLERLGLTDGDITVSMTGIAGIQSLGGANVHSLVLKEIIEDSIQYTLNTGIAFGDPITYVIETYNGSWTRRDTIYKTYGLGTTVFADNCNSTANWSGNWSFTNEAYVSANNSITDSPFTDYSNNANTSIVLNQNVTFTNATYAYANFYAKWAIEDNYDYVEFMISTDGGTSWTALCGKYTNEGGANQDTGEPLYDGFQTDWVFEEVDLFEYLGSANVNFKFRLVSDGGVKEDGFYFDDFEIFTDGTSQSNIGFNDLNLDEFLIYPNPANTELNVIMESQDGVSSIEITNNLGQVVKQIKPTGNIIQISLVDLAEGSYFISMIGVEGNKVTKQFSLIR